MHPKQCIFPLEVKIKKKLPTLYFSKFVLLTSLIIHVSVCVIFDFISQRHQRNLDSLFG